MATSGHQPPSPSVAVVGAQYCVPYPFNLTITQKALSITHGDFAVTDDEGNVILQVKGKWASIRTRRILKDAVGNPILTLQEKLLTVHRRWEAFRGESTDEKDLLFTAKISSLIQLKTKLDVFLAPNNEVCKFKIKGSYFERSCTIYNEDSSQIIAQMSKKYTAKNIILGKDTFGVTVYPNVDYAFIVALIIILNEINTDRNEATIN